MTYYMDLGNYTLVFSDSHFSYARKKPTISVYDKDLNVEQKIASFNNKEAFEWFANILKDKEGDSGADND